MLGLGQKLTSESFQLSLVTNFMIGCSNMSQSSVIIKKLNHLQKRKQKKKIRRSFTKSNYMFHLPQVKQNLISSRGNLIYELPHERPNKLQI